MSNNKQSSVESLFYKMVQSFELFESKELTYQEYVKEILQHKEKAKAMHKKEVKTCMSFAFLDGLRSGDENYKSPYQVWEQYYKEKYGGNNESNL